MSNDAQTYTIIGAIIAIAASIFNAVGYTVQKKGHNNLKIFNHDKPDSEKKKLIKEKTWATGFSIYLIGGLLNAVSLFYAPQSLVLPLSAITLVANTMLATKVLDEPFFKSDIIGMLAVIIGSVLAVIFGPRTAGGEATMNELKERWGDSGYFLFFIVLSACIVADYLAVRFYEKKNRDDDTVTDQLKHGAAFLLISYCLLAGYFGSLAFLFLKSFTEFIGSSWSSKETSQANAANWYSYFTLIGVIITNVALEFFRQRGLAYFHAVYVVPINQVVLIVMGTILGGLYFEEFDSMPALDAGMFIFAIFMTVVGVFVLAFNSGNVSEKTEAKINHTITLSLDGTNGNFNLPGLPPIPSVIGTSPSLPITRSVNDDIPDMPPPGMAGMAGRIHGLHRSMASMHFTKEGKPFYLDKDGNILPFGLEKLSISNTFGLGRIAHMNGRKRGHVKNSQSLPTYSHSGIDSGASDPDVSNGMREVELAGMDGSVENIARFKRMERVQTDSRSSYNATSPEFNAKRSLSNGYPVYANGKNGYHVGAKVANIGRPSLTGISEESEDNININRNQLTPAPSSTNGKHINGNGTYPHVNGKHSNGKHTNGKHINGNGYKNGQNGKSHIVSKHKMSNLDLEKEEVNNESEIVIVTKKMSESNEIVYKDDTPEKDKEKAIAIDIEVADVRSSSQDSDSHQL